MIGSVLHRAAGLIVSADRPLPGFVHEPANTEPAEVCIHLETRPAWHAADAAPLHAAQPTSSTGEPTVSVSRSPHGFHFSYADGTRVWIDAAATDVWCTWPPSASLDDTCTYLYGPILALLLRLRGALAFHASAVQIGGGAIGFAGPHGAGKSTLAAALGAIGCPVITDDVLRVSPADGSWMVHSFASMLKLWPDGARLALGASAELPRIAAGWDKRALALGERIPAASEALPLTALACFGDAVADPTVERISPATALLRLAANSSASRLLDRGRRAAEFRALSALVRDVPCVMLRPPSDPRDYRLFVERVFAWAAS